VRSHLDELESMDPDTAWAAKSGGRGTADVAVVELRRRVAAVARRTRARQVATHRAFARLLGGKR
jgi:hypothetical protein